MKEGFHSSKVRLGERAVVFVPGMLYDTENKPEKCILSSLERRLGVVTLTCMAAATERDANYDIREKTMHERADDICETISRLVESNDGIEHVSIVAHSAGALAVCESLEGLPRNISTDVHFLAPPNPNSEPIAQIKNALDTLLPVDYREALQTRYKSREGNGFVVTERVWQSVEEVSGKYRSAIAAGDQTNTAVFIAKRDRAFSSTVDDFRAISRVPVVELDDSHSFKQSQSTDRILSSILNLETE